MTKGLKGYLESVQRGDCFVFIQGWVCYLDNSPASSVNIEILGLGVAHSISLQPRTDLVSAGILGPAAFNTLFIGDGLNVDDISVMVSTRDSEPTHLNQQDSTDFVPFGAIDVISDDGLSGWIFDPKSLIGLSSTYIVIADQQYALQLTEARPDLPYTFIGCTEKLGFRLSLDELRNISGAIAAGRSDGGTVSIKLESSGVLIDRKKVPVPAKLCAEKSRLETSPPDSNNPTTFGALPQQSSQYSSALLTERAKERTLGIFHEYFDHKYYSKTYMGEETDSVSALLHFLSSGLAADARPSPLVDVSFMRQLRQDLFSSPSEISEIINALELNLCDPSPFFSLAYYKAEVKNVALGQPLLRHFLSTANKEFKRPNPYFDLNHYRKHLDKHGESLNDFYDFVLRGDKLALSSSKHFDPARYVAESAGEFEKIGPLEHYLRYGRYQGRKIHSLSKSRTGGLADRRQTSEWKIEIEALAWRESYEQLTATLATEARRSLVEFREKSLLQDLPWCAQDISALRFDVHEEPLIEIIVPAYNEFRHTLNALLSIANSEVQAPYRVLLVDDASPDDEMAAFADVPGLLYIRNPENLHFLRSCNSAFRQCKAKYVVLLNNDALMYPDTLQRLLDVIEADPTIGCVGPKILYPNGRLQEAGCCIFSDGNTRMIGVGDDPNRACYNYDRDVDYVSGACIMFRRDAVDGDLFDERFRPAYCEDSDLALRSMQRGLRNRYVADARAIHHLSVSTAKESEIKRVQLSARNQAKLAEKWTSLLSEKSRIRVLSFYLPQFHPIAENDLWWGRGFTEWTNIARAVPSYSGHYQPHLPADLGYYDLRMPEILGQQQRMARRYGLEGFVVYYYNFGAKKILWQPMANLLANKDVDFRFCLCWANENWSKHWDGGEREVLLAQSYETETLEAVCQDFIAAAADPRAITVNGKPLVLIYRPLLFPDIRAFTALLRRRFAEAGFVGVHLCYAESMEAVAKGIRPSEIGFDAAVEFPPQGVGAPANIRFEETKDDWEGKVYDYEASVMLACNRPPCDYTRYPGVFPSWDNTPRQPLKATSFHNSSPELFQAYVEAKVNHLNNFFVGEERLLFVNAWNEWAEGTHLEPDKAYGHAWLEALRNAVS